MFFSPPPLFFMGSDILLLVMTLEEEVGPALAISLLLAFSVGQTLQELMLCSGRKSPAQPSADCDESRVCQILRLRTRQPPHQ